MRSRASGTFELDLPASVAIRLFTPEGERDWVPGWDPSYPDGRASERPGTVFTTNHGSVSTTWIIDVVDHDRRRASDTRLTPGSHAGKVEVRASDLGRGRCRVEVRYDLTLLEGATSDVLAPYEPAAFPAMMREWSALIATHLDSRP